MKRVAVPALLVLLVLASCQTTNDLTPTDYLYAAKSAYTVAVEAVTALADAGHIKLDDAEKFEAVRARTDAMLQAAQKAIDEGADFSFADLKAAIKSLQDIVVIISQGVRDGSS